MKKYLLLALSAFFITTGVLIILNLDRLKPKGYGGLMVTANILSKVYLDNKALGNTPLCKCTQKDYLQEGQYTLKIEPQDKKFVPFTTKINIQNGILTAVDRTFLPGSYASAYILNLEKINSRNSEIEVISIPDQALASVDNASQKLTPFLVENVTATDHNIELAKNGFAKKTIRIKTVPSYKLVVNAILGTKSENQIDLTQTPIPTKTASESAYVKILDTPTGFLRVRSKPDISSEEITRVDPGSTFPYVDQQEDWIAIKLKDGRQGWVSSTFAEKVNLP